MRAICSFAYAVSLMFSLFLAFKVVQLRSRCIEERAKISKMISHIQDLKKESAFLKAKYFSNLKPEIVDRRTGYLHLFREDEVYYLK